MYLIIFEDGELSVVDGICEGDKISAERGLIDIVRFHNGAYQSYRDGEFKDISE